jgi:hypothetical protein
VVRALANYGRCDQLWLLAPQLSACSATVGGRAPLAVRLAQFNTQVSKAVSDKAAYGHEQWRGSQPQELTDHQGQELQDVLSLLLGGVLALRRADDLLTDVLQARQRQHNRQAGRCWDPR